MSREYTLGPVTEAEKAKERVTTLENAILHVFGEVGLDVTAESQTEALRDLYALIDLEA